MKATGFSGNSQSAAHRHARCAPTRQWFLGAALVGSFALAGGLLGCSAPVPAEKPEPCDVQVVTLNLYAADNINPNESDKPRPVVVRLYQLATDMKMLNAKYDDILLEDEKVLGKDLLKKDEVEVYPNDLVEVKFERLKDASVLCGAAMFRGPKGHSWKTYYTFPPMPNSKCGKKKEEGADGGADPKTEPQAEPRTAFFVESSKIDNGTQFDESMFPASQSVRKIALSKRSADSDSFNAPTQGATPAKP